MRTVSLYYRFVLIAVMFSAGYRAQNNLILQLDNGAPFQVFVNDKLYNDSAQSQVQIYDLLKDTVLVKVQVGPSQRYGITVYLLDKGKKTSGKEFTYLLRREKNRLHPVFMGMNQVTTFRPKNEPRN